MVFLKANIAVGSFLSRGTHVWLEILGPDGEKATFSGSKRDEMLHVLRDYKRDFERAHTRGLLEIPPPEGMTDEEWRVAVLNAGVEVQDEMHGNYAFNGFWPWGETNAKIPRSNCCRVLVNIIERAGGEIPDGKIKGVHPGLWSCWKDYL